MKTRRFNYHGYPLTESYFNAMLNRGHTEGSADYYARLVKKVESYMIICGISNINEEVANSFFEWWVDKSNPSADLQKRMTVILRRLEQMISGDVIDYSLPRKIPLSLPGHIQLSIDAFENFLSRYKGLKPDTIRNQTDAVQRFFSVNSISCLKDISLFHIEYGFAQSGQKEVYKSAMRKYLDFLFQEGTIEADLGEVLPMILPRIPNSYPLPSVYTDEEIRAILGSIDRSTVQGSRDFAILMLASSLGIRASDICEMTLEAINFVKNELSFIQKKTSVPLPLPLLPDVKEALLGYLGYRKIDSTDEPIFIQCRAPYHKLTRMGIWTIMRRYVKQSGVDPGHRKRGTHALRSSLASSMVREQVPYYAVQKILGHESPQSTKNYVRIDIGRLREFTLPVPEAYGRFDAFLKGGETR